MQRHMRNLVQSVVVAVFLATVSIAQAETGSLELKRLESQDPSRRVFNRIDYIYRSTQPQHFFLNASQDGRGSVQYHGDEQQAATFKKLVKKEPEYNCERPFKGVAKLGTQEFAFALDSSAPKPAPKDEKSEKEKAEAKAEPKADSAVDKLKEKVAKKTAATTVTMPVYDRLYFDVNHNGDLTDDNVIEGEVQTYPQSSGQSYAQITFPKLDVTFEADGTAMESAFFFSGHVNSSSNNGYAGIQINAGAYREGEITLEGKKRRVVLIDFNSNGRFDDETKIVEIIRRTRNGKVDDADKEFYPQGGDMLLIDPGQSQGMFDSPYDVASSDYRYNVSKLINIEDRFYDLKITPAGDKLTLEASNVATGNIKNPNDGYRALIFDDKKTVLKISGNKDVPIPVPEGEWKLLSYTINLPETPVKPTEPAKQAEKEPSALKLLEDAIKAFIEKPMLHTPMRPRWTRVSARATGGYKAVKVVKGETVEMPFGPPYKPLVTVPYYGNPGQVELEMSLVGSAGEVCSDMYVHGGRPGKPEFTITDPKGEVVQQGSFEYG